LGFGFGYNNSWVLGLGVKIFGFWVRFGYKNFWVLGFGFRYSNFWVLGLGIKTFGFWVLGLGIIPNPIPKPKTQFFLGKNVCTAVSSR